MNINTQITNSAQNIQAANAKTPVTPSTNKNSFLNDLSQNKLKEAMSQYVNLSHTKEIHEEQLQYVLVNAILTSKSKKLGDEYTKIFASHSAQSRSTEDNVKSSLQELIQGNLITKEDAEAIHGMSFKAAQLDNNLNALYDGTAGPNDPTKATAEAVTALDKANAMIQSIREGKESFTSRALEAPSNTVQQSSAVSGTSEILSLDVSSSSQSNFTTSASQGRGGNGFLWKPQSDNNGRLVVLTPPELAGNVVSTEVHSSLPPSQSSLIEKGSYSGNGNGGRDHFRFSKSGGSYPDGVFVIARLRNGEYVSYSIPDTNSRQVK